MTADQPAEHPAKRRTRLLAAREADTYRGRPLTLCVDHDVEPPLLLRTPVEQQRA
jgi:hypothetical protein